MLVDDAIIAIEIMVVKMEEGLDRIKAAAYAWSNTAAPMLTGTLVTVIGFTPVGFAKSTAGEYAGNIFWIVGFALLPPGSWRSSLRRIWASSCCLSSSRSRVGSGDLRHPELPPFSRSCHLVRGQ